MSWTCVLWRVGRARCLVVLAAALVVGFLGARSPSQEAAASEGAPQPVDVGGAMGIRDAATGEIREPTQEEAAALGEALRSRLGKAREGLAGTRNADGSLTLDLRGRAFTAAVGVPGADGAVTTGCVEDAGIHVRPADVAVTR